MIAAIIMDTMTRKEDGRWRGETPTPVPAGMQTMTRKEVAALLGVDQRAVTRYAASGVLKKYEGPRSGIRKAGPVVFDRNQVLNVDALRRSAGTPQRPKPRW